MKTLTLLMLALFASLISPQVLANAAETHKPTVEPEAEKRLIDPTRPNWFGIKKSKQKSRSLVLNSLVMSPQRRIAVINGELMREGDTRHGVTLQQILSDRVLIVTKSGKKRALKLNNSGLRISKNAPDRSHKLAQKTEGTAR